MIYSNANISIFKNIIGRVGLTLFTLGLFVPFMWSEYIYWMCINLREPPYSKKYKIGVLQLSIITLGLYGLHYFIKSKNIFVRYTSKLITILLNIVVYGVIYYFGFLKLQTEYKQYTLLLLCLINYPVYLIAKYFTYNEGARYICSMF